MTVRTVTSWICDTCGIREPGTPDACHRAAEKHVRATGHTTVTHMEPEAAK